MGGPTGKALLSVPSEEAALRSLPHQLVDPHLLWEGRVSTCAHMLRQGPDAGMEIQSWQNVLKLSWDWNIPYSSRKKSPIGEVTVHPGWHLLSWCPTWFVGKEAGIGLVTLYLYFQLPLRRHLLACESHVQWANFHVNSKLNLEGNNVWPAFPSQPIPNSM